MAKNLLEKTIEMLANWGITNPTITTKEEKIETFSGKHYNKHVITFIIDIVEKIDCEIDILETITNLGKKSFSYTYINGNASWIGSVITINRMNVDTAFELFEILAKGKPVSFILAKESLERNETKILENLAIIRKLEHENEQLLEQIIDDKRRMIYGK